MNRDRQRGAVFLGICVFLVYGMFVLRKYEAYTFTRYDPGWMICAVMSIVGDGDLDLRNQLANDPNRAADQTSRGARGEWYPLHEYLMAVVTVPFYLLLGVNGCLLFNLVILTLLMLLLYRICLCHLDSLSAFTAVALTAFASLFTEYSYSYSLDVFSTFMLVLSYYVIIRTRCFLGGIAWGLAVYARLANAVTLVGVLPFLVTNGWSWPGRTERDTSVGNAVQRAKPVFLFLVGCVPAAICLLGANWWMYGSPFLTSYERWQRFPAGSAVVSTQMSAFSCSVVERLPGVLLDTQSGLIVGGPLMIAAVIYGVRSYWHEAPREALLVALTCAAQIYMYSKYCLAVPGSPGNRYLMPVVALCAVPLGFAVRDCFSRSSRDRRGGQGGAA